MKKININPTDLSHVLWNKVLENSAIKSDIYKKEFFSKIDSLDKLRAQSDYNTGSISSTTSWLLYSLIIYFKPKKIVEVGSFIGKSTVSMALGADNYADEGISEIYSCDMSNNIALPKLAKTQIKQFNKTNSLDMLKKIDGNFSFDLMHVDGRLGLEDFEIIKKNMNENTIFVLDDFEGKEKGVINYINFLKCNMNLNNFYLLSYPIQAETKLKFSLLEKSHSAVLIPSNLIGFSNQ